MRTCSTLAALLVLNLCLSSSSVAGDEPAPSPGDVAEWIRSGEPEALDRAAAAGANLTAAQLREVLTEIRDQSRVHAVLRRKRIRGLTLDQVDLGQVASYLRTVSGVDFFVTPPAVERGIEDVVLHQGAED